MTKLKHLIKKSLLSLKPVVSRDFFILFGFYAVLQLAFTYVVVYKNEFKLSDPTVFVYFAEKFILDFAVFMSIVIFLLKLFRKAVFPAYIFACFYMLLITANMVVYFFASTLLENHYFALITPYSLESFANLKSVFALIVLTVMSIGIRLPIKNIAFQATWASAIKWAILAIFVASSGFAQVFSTRKTEDKRLDKVIMVFRNAQLEYSSQNPIASFVNDVVLKEFSNSLWTMKGSKKYRKFMKSYNLVAQKFYIEKDYSSHKSTIDKYKLNLNKHYYNNLKLKSFNKIIIIFVESLSLKMLQCHNDQLSSKTSSFLCSNNVVAHTFNNFRTSGSPTLQGLTTFFSGHPNYNIQQLTGNKLSFVKVLKKQGYKTFFIRSASKFFANENIIFKKWGFDKIIAREDFYKRKHLQKFIYGWGLEDRKLYNEVFDKLKKHKDEKIFISVLGTDTHPLHGQQKFKHLKYPAILKDTKKKWGFAKHFLKAVHHTDFDLQQFVKRLKTNGLFGDDTLVVITADHSCPPNSVTRKIPGQTKKSLGHIPLIFLTNQKLPTFNNKVMASQIDFAPTLFHLLNLQTLSGWWGQSLFAKTKTDLFVGFHNNLLQIETKNNQTLLNIKKPKDEKLNKLFSTIVTD